MAKFIVFVILGAIAYVLISVALRLSPGTLETRVSIRVESHETELYVRMPYGNCVFSFEHVPQLSAVTRFDPEHLSDVACHTVIRRDGETLFETREKQFSWRERNRDKEPIQIICSASEAKGRPVYLNIKPGF